MTFYEERCQFKNCNIGANNKHTSNAFGHCAFNHKIKLSYLRPATNTSLYFATKLYSPDSDFPADYFSSKIFKVHMLFKKSQSFQINSNPPLPSAIDLTICNIFLV